MFFTRNFTSFVAVFFFMLFSTPASAPGIVPSMSCPGFESEDAAYAGTAAVLARSPKSTALVKVWCSLFFMPMISLALNLWICCFVQSSS